MALRNYLYAKHLDPHQAALISTDTMLKNLPAVPRGACSSGKELVMEDGSRVCRNCSDCPKKAVSAVDKPAVEVHVEKEVCYN